ncbi:MAG TPA: lytic transglycosylase domain-containing protein [Bryobacteraceae bacterium]|nr:lytic transglycosylase domain-containing protein [Bryobacteraceae bacterium]
MRYLIALVVGVGLAALLSRRSEYVPQLPAGQYADIQPTPTNPEPDPLPSPDVQANPVSEAIDMVANTVKNTAADVMSVFGTKYDELINVSAREAGIDPGILYRLLRQESHFREDIISGRVRSPTGALGIAQFMPPTAREWLGSEANALIPSIAIPGAARYLRWLSNQFGGDMQKAVAAYNWGIGNVQRKGLGSAPSETRAYVQAITGEPIA